MRQRLGSEERVGSYTCPPSRRPGPCCLMRLCTSAPDYWCGLRGRTGLDRQGRRSRPLHTCRGCSPKPPPPRSTATLAPRAAPVGMAAGAAATVATVAAEEAREAAERERVVVARVRAAAVRGRVAVARVRATVARAMEAAARAASVARGLGQAGRVVGGRGSRNGVGPGTPRIFRCYTSLRSRRLCSVSPHSSPMNREASLS